MRTTFKPMSKRRYVRLLAALTEPYPWLAECHAKIEPAPGHIGIIQRFLADVDDLLRPSPNQFLQMLWISSNQGGLTISQLTSCPARNEAIRHLASEAMREASTTCGVCGYRHWTEELGAKPSRCIVHEGTTAQFAEDFRQIERERQQKEAARETEPSPQIQEVQAESMVLPSAPLISLLDFEKARHFHQTGNTRTKEQRDRLALVWSRICKNGGGIRQLAMIPEDWQGMVTEFEAHFPNFAALAQIMANHFALSALGDRRLSLPPILLLGNPGVGKTEAARWLAEKLATPFLKLDMATAQCGAHLAGSDSFWSNTREGALFELLTNHRQANPIVMLDELDKTSGDQRYPAINSLYTLLEPRSAREFVDLSIQAYAIDASHVNWIATANSLNTIPDPILSRMTVLHVPDPSPTQVRQIAGKIYQRMRNESTWGQHFSETLHPEIAEHLSQQSPRSVGLLLQQALGAAARAGRTELLYEDVRLLSVPVKPALGFHAYR